MCIICPAQLRSVVYDDGNDEEDAGAPQAFVGHVRMVCSSDRRLWARGGASSTFLYCKVHEQVMLRVITRCTRSRDLLLRVLINVTWCACGE